MTIGDLKELIERCPDSLEIYIDDPNYEEYRELQFELEQTNDHSHAIVFSVIDGD
jgi:hypothetical protein